MSQPHVVVLGSCNLDQIVSGFAFPAAGATVTATGFREEPGGKGLNQAVAAARAGARVTFIGATGTDPAGDQVRAVLEESGVGTRLLRHADAPTGRATILVDDTGDNRIVITAGANGTLDALTDADVAVIESADALMLQLETPQALSAKAAEVAASAGVPVFLTPAPVAEVRDDLLAVTSVLLVNEHESLELSGRTDPDGAHAALLDLVPAALVTLGDRGSVWCERDGTTERCAARQVEVVDTTGAGDTFAGYLVASRAAGLPLDESLARATAAAALMVGRPGTSSAIPTEAEVDALLWK